MNSQTREAIRDFQRRMGLRADGIVGPEMQQALVDERHKLVASGAPASWRPISSSSQSCHYQKKRS